MRRFLALCWAMAIFTTTTCVDQGNLVIRCPDSGGLIAVPDGPFTIDGVPIRLTADLTGGTIGELGTTFVIELQLPSVPADRTPVVECVRLSKADQGERWDAIANHVRTITDGSNERIQASDGDGPHWTAGDLIDVVVWLKTTSGRHVLSLGRQPVHK